MVGVIVSAMPMPPTTSAGTIDQKRLPWSSCANSTSETASSDMPPPISQREPTRSEARPATGASRMIRNVIGRKSAPVSIAE